jgi:hypothetical protein
MAAPVVGYDAIAVFEEEQHLRVPVIGRQRPTMAEHDRLSTAPVLIVDLDVFGIFLPDSNVWHWNPSFLYLCRFSLAALHNAISGSSPFKLHSQFMDMLDCSRLISRMMVSCPLLFFSIFKIKRKMQRGDHL